MSNMEIASTEETNVGIVINNKPTNCQYFVDKYRNFIVKSLFYVVIIYITISLASIIYRLVAIKDLNLVVSFCYINKIFETSQSTTYNSTISQ